MIKFFRQIRKSYLLENKTSKYFKYAIGEIILVVIGILIALQINNWNENRKNTIAEKEFIKGIVNDLQSDKKLIEIVFKLIETKTNAYSILNSESFDTSNNIKYRDSLLGVYLFSGQRTFYPISGSFESAVAGNQINTYKQKELTQKIIKLYSSTYSRLIDNGKILDNRWNDLSKIYTGERRKKAFSINNDENFSKMLDNIYYHYLQLNWYNKVLKKSETEINELLQKLNE